MLRNNAVGTTIYVYDGDNIIEELAANRNSVARYAQGLGIDEPLAMLCSSTTSFYQADGLGSITSLTKTSGAVAATYTYDSFGKTIATTGTILYPCEVAGRERDLETDQYYNRARSDQMHAALHINIPNYASAIVTTNEVVDSISSLQALSRKAD
jgi:hypothetical protein